MFLGKNGEDEEDEKPHCNEECEHQKNDSPSRCVLRAPQVCPRAAIRRRKEEVLNDNHDEEPTNNTATEKGFVEIWNLAWGLAIVGGQRGEEDQADDPENYSNGDGDCCGERRGREGFLLVSGGSCCNSRTPVEEGRHKDRLGSLDDTGTINPGFDWSTT